MAAVDTLADAAPRKLLYYSGISTKPQREVRFGAYILGSTLGEGEFGKVKLGWRKDGRHPSQVAIKLIKRDTIVKDSESEIKIYREINSLRLLNHPNIVNLVEVLKSGKYIGIVLEYASGGELFDYILRHKYLKENIAKKLFAQLVSGVDYMHSKGLVHRDLKLENLLLDKHKNIIISDFGFVNSYNQSKNDYMKTSCGSPCYAAPELVLTQSPYAGRKVDIWSLGVILYAMLSGYLPFDDDADNEDGADIVKLYKYICSNPLTFPEYVSPLARDLLRRIIVPDPAKRIGMKEIKNHPWLAPHASLLSVTQPEWDGLRTEDIEVKQRHTTQNKYKRNSMFNETTSSSSLMLTSSNNPHGRSYTSNSNIVYSNPTTSSSLANVVALSKENKISNSSSSALSQTVSPSESAPITLIAQDSPSKAKEVNPRGKASHSGASYSSASNALKAVSSDRKASSEGDSSVDTKASLSRSGTYSSAFSTIVESPTSNDFDKKSDNKSQNKTLATEKLPQQRKPRPTSYHPSSMSSSIMSLNNNSSSVLEYMKMSPPSGAIPPFLSTSPTRSVKGSDSFMKEIISENASSQTQITPRSVHRRDSVVTPINVNGVFGTDMNNQENKRNSVLSYLEDKMEALELTELHSPIRQPAEELGITSTASIPKLDMTLLLPSDITPKIDQLPVFDGPVSFPEQSGEKVATKPADAEPPVSSERRTVSAGSDSTIKREKNKENREAKETKKKNRFSMLSFYSASNYSSNSITSGAKKILEPSNEANIIPTLKEQKRADDSLSDNSQSRKSTPTSSNIYTSGKEASAARKVMNFFKRRSVRLGS